MKILKGKTPWDVNSREKEGNIHIHACNVKSFRENILSKVICEGFCFEEATPCCGSKYACMITKMSN